MISQEQVLNRILETKDYSLIALNNLSEDHFNAYKQEFNFIKNHYEAYGVVPDKTTFIKNFPDFNIFEVNEPNSFLIEQLISDYNMTYLAKSFNNIKKLLEDGKVDQATKYYQKAVENLQTGITLESIDILKDTHRLDDYIKKTQNPNKYYISTGFPELDKIIGGIDREEELAVIVARTNLGKSMIAIKMALAAAAQGLTVGFYSGEMSENKVGYRVDTFISHINSGNLLHGNKLVQKEYEQYMSELPTKYTGSFKVLTPKMINGPATVDALRLFIEKEHLDILVVDQLSLLEDRNNAKVPFERAANISKDLKNLQVLKRIPIISVSQQNRTGLKDQDGKDEQQIDTTQLAMSDRIAQDATLIIGITRDKKDNSLMNLHVVKARDAAVGAKLTYKTDLGRGIWQYIPSADDVADQTTEYANRYEVKENQDSGEEVF